MTDVDTTSEQHADTRREFTTLSTRSRAAKALLLFNAILLMMLLVYDLALSRGMELRPTLPPNSVAWWSLPWDVGECNVKSGAYHAPGDGVMWVELSSIVGALVVWAWALHVSRMAARSRGFDRVPRPAASAAFNPAGILLFALPTAIVAGPYYIAELWRRSAPGTETKRWGVLPVAWCSLFVAQFLVQHEVIGVRGRPMAEILVGLTLELMVVIVGIKLVQRIDARILQRLT